MKQHRRLYGWEDGKLVEIGGDDERYNVTRPGKQFGLAVPRTLPLGNGSSVTIKPGKRERRRMGA
jgi:hypothetical protein